MKIKILIMGVVVIMVTACETVPTVPTKRPMTEVAKSQIGNPDVHLNANHYGIGSTWFQTQTNGGGQGLAGVIGAAIADAIINAFPASRAMKTADEVAESIVADDLNTSFMNALKVTRETDPSNTSLGMVSLVNGFDKSVDNDGKIVLSLEYRLSEDASAFKVSAVARYENTEISYVTPYTFEGKMPKSHASGALYSNGFVFNSSQFDRPVLTEALKVKLVKSVENSFRDEEGKLPTEGSEYRKMQKGIEKANDDKLTKSETSIFLVQSWLKDDAAPLKAEVNLAHQFIVKYLVKDINSDEVPSLNGEDRIYDNNRNERVVKLIGSGNLAGSYVSEPGNVTSFTTYGNAVSYSKTGRKTAKHAKVSN